MAGTDRATTIMAVGTIVSALATVWLATGTRSLAKGTKALVEAARAESEQSAAANQRGYALAIYQIERHSKVEVYEALVGYMDDDILRVELKATALGMTFDGQGVGPTTSIDEKALMTNQLLLKLAMHGTLEITNDFGHWLKRMTELTAELTSLETWDQYAQVQPIQDSTLLVSAQASFNMNHEWAKNWYLDALLKIDRELHPNPVSFEKGVVEKPLD